MRVTNASIFCFSELLQHRRSVNVAVLQRIITADKTAYLCSAMGGWLEKSQCEGNIVFRGYILKQRVIGI